MRAPRNRVVDRRRTLFAGLILVVVVFGIVFVVVVVLVLVVLPLSSAADAVRPPPCTAPCLESWTLPAGAPRYCPPTAG